MKKLALYITILYTSIGFAQTVSLDCESGSRSIDWGNCWEFGAISYRNKSNEVINGTWTARGNSLTNSSLTACFLKSPWLLPASGNITFDTRLLNTSGTNGSQYKAIKIRFITHDVNASNEQGVTISDEIDYTYASPYTSVKNLSFAIPSSIANSGNPYKVMFSFYGQGGNNRPLIDDIVIPGTYYSDPSNGCVPLAQVADADNDGVSDDDDEYPNDQNKAYTSYYPAAGSFGTIAFEDLWPSKGDYDFNDMVVDYSATYILNASNKVVETKTQIYVRAVGAGVINAFGIEYPSISPSDISSVNGYVHNAGYINLNANGTEAGQTNAVIIPFDDVEAVINRVGGLFYNVVSGDAMGQSDSLNITTIFSTPQELSDVSNINPFMIKAKTRTLEIHLPDYTPTDLADMAVFGTSDDDSDPNTGRFYKTPENLPWAILIPQRFDYPAEKNDIILTHTKFAGWAQSSGTSFNNWYEDESGYRDANKLFQ
jgi:LruC domain-containing protein